MNPTDWEGIESSRFYYILYTQEEFDAFGRYHNTTIDIYVANMHFYECYR